MKKLVTSLLLAVSLAVHAEEPELLPWEIEYTPIEVSRIFDQWFVLDESLLLNLIDKEAKIAVCVEDYIRTQSKSYSKIVQNNLYDLIHNFDRIASRIYGKRAPADEISFDDKLEALANIQCEAYFTIGVIK